MTPIVLLVFLIAHWIFDFVFQRHIDAINKSKSMYHLLCHTTTYSLCWISVIWYITGNIGDALLFCIITMLLHTFTDYYTSRLNSYLYKKGDIHNFFVAVGFDQILHYLQLYFTFILLT